MKDSNTFQTILLFVFGFFIIIAVLGFAGILPGFGGKNEKVFLGNVTIWGTLPERTVSGLIGDVYAGEESVKITYKQKSAETFDRDLVEALASAVGPDVILLPQDLIVRHRDKISPISYETVSQRGFQDRFIEEAELYLSNAGILALPLTIDPMVMYWNRDLFSAAGISSVPKTWDEYRLIVPRLTKKDRTGANIVQSALPFGEFRNVDHAKDILSLLILQAGNPITQKLAEQDEKVVSVLKEQFNLDIPPTEAALRFFTEFSNPVKESYTWNRSLPSSQEAFVAGSSAVYVGYASERAELERKNPHLNFDVAQIPQPSGLSRAITFGNMEALAILKSSPNFTASFRAVALLSDTDFVDALSKDLGLPPARRDLLGGTPPDAFAEVFYDAALISRAWLDPAPERTETVFQNMVEVIVSGRSKISEAVSAASVELTRLLR